MEHRPSALSTHNHEFNIPSSCPFTISKINSSPGAAFSAWLIREHDEYGEYPHIYAKLCQVRNDNSASSKAKVIVLSDTGCGTDVPNLDSVDRLAQQAQQQPESWNIATFLEYTINPNGRIPYLVISTHCHYDHILGFYKLLPTAPTVDHEDDSPSSGKPTGPPTRILASAKAPSFITPYPTLQKHSLCSTVNRKAPDYIVSTWAFDFMQVNYSYTSPAHSSSPSSSSPSSTVSIPTGITIVHTQGHTPDSLSWYDSDTRLICVGDSFYTKESALTRNAPWGREAPMPTIFCAESDLAAWWGALGKILGFVREKNGEFERQAQVEVGFVGVGVREWLDAQDALDVIEATFQSGLEEEPWLLINKSSCRSPPPSSPHRVRLCAAHTTFNLDAEDAILEIKDFMAAVLRSEVPSKSAGHGSRGQERWLWDYALDEKSETNGKYSVLAPLHVVERGRETIPKEQWSGL